jgi:hypothetical protein
MEEEEQVKSKRSVRLRADEIKPFRCKNLIAVLENPTDVKNIGTVIRNVNALGAFLGLALSAAATAAISRALCVLRSVPFGKYCRSSPLVFSLVPRCHGLCGSQK